MRGRKAVVLGDEILVLGLVGIGESDGVLQRSRSDLRTAIDSEVDEGGPLMVETGEAATAVDAKTMCGDDMAPWTCNETASLP